MATSVQIELLVDEKGAVSGIRAFDAAVKGTTASTRNLNTEMQRMSMAAPPVRWAQGVKEIGIRALTSLDNVRLLRDDLGIRIPRSMEKAIASSKTLSAIVNGIGASLLTVGAIQIGASLFTGLIKGSKELWENHLSLTKAAQDYAAEVQRSAHDDFGNTRSIETTRVRIDEATEAVKRFHEESIRQAHKAPAITWRSSFDLVAPGAGSAFDAYHNRERAAGLEGQSVDAQRQLNELKQKQAPEQIHQGKLDSIELEHAGDGRLRTEHKITAEKFKQHEIAKENMLYEASREGLYANYVKDNNVKFSHGSKEQIAREKQDANLGDLVAQNSGEASYGTKNKIADEKADAELFNLRREQGQELAHMRAEALEAGLRGVALYRAQEAAAIEDLKFKDMDSAAARDAVHLKFHNEEMKRLEDEGRETEKIKRDVSLGGMNGIGAIQMRGANRVADINADPNLSPDAKSARIVAAQQETNAQILEAQKSFTEQVDAIVEQSQSRELTGFARIRAEAEKTSNDLHKRFDTNHHQMDVSTPKGQADLDADTATLGTGLNAIGSEADRQNAALTERNAQQTLEIEEGARIKSLSAEKQKTAAIEAEYEKRLQLYQEELKKQEIGDDDFNRRVAAAAQERDAELAEASREAHEKMASEFDSLFKSLDHPLKALESMGTKIAGNAAASLVQYVQGRGHGGGAGDGTGQDGLFGMMSNFSFGGKKPLGVGADRAAETGTHGTHAVTQATFSIASAVIRVGSVSFAGGGAGSGSPSSGGGLDGSGAFSDGTYGSGDFGGYRSGGGFGLSSGTSSMSSGISFASGTTGGAGYGGGAGAVPSFAGHGESPSPSGSRIGGAIGNVSQGFAMARGLGNVFHRGQQLTPSGAGGDGTAETQDDPMSGSSISGSGNGGMFGGGGFSGNAMGAAGGAMGVFSAAEGNGGLGGALQGGLAGMQLGMALGGPIGAAIGAAGGAIIGAIGIGGREKARVYDLKNVRPQLTADQDAYNQGNMDYMTAYSDVQGMIGSSWGAIRSMGPSAMAYWNDTIKPELTQAMGKFTAEQRAGRSMYTAQQASYAVGTDYVPYDQTAQIHQGESIYTADRTERATRALESGADLSRVHESYKNAMRAGPSRSSAGGDRTMNMNVHAIDSQGVAQFLDKYKHHIRAAVNNSYAENSGGGL